jgi:hypothetical protein
MLPMDINEIRQRLKDLLIECAKEVGAVGVEDGAIAFGGEDAKEKAFACKKLFEERRKVLMTKIQKDFPPGVSF